MTDYTDAIFELQDSLWRKKLCDDIGFDKLTKKDKAFRVAHTAGFEAALLYLQHLQYKLPPKEEEADEGKNITFRVTTTKPGALEGSILSASVPGHNNIDLEVEDYDLKDQWGHYTTIFKGRY